MIANGPTILVVCHETGNCNEEPVRTMLLILAAICVLVVVWALYELWRMW